MRTVSRLILVMALLAALVPLTALADESSEYPTTPLTADQAMVIQAAAQIAGASTTADKANATAIYELRMGAAMGHAEADLAEAQAMVNMHPKSAGALAQLAGAQANYDQLLKICGLPLWEPTAGPAVAVTEPFFDVQGGDMATMPMPESFGP